MARGKMNAATPLFTLTWDPPSIQVPLRLKPNRPCGPRGDQPYYLATTVTGIDFEQGVFEISAVRPMGTSTFSSGKYPATAPFGNS